MQDQFPELHRGVTDRHQEHHSLSELLIQFVHNCLDALAGLVESRLHIAGLRVVEVGRHLGRLGSPIPDQPGGVKVCPKVRIRLQPLFDQLLCGESLRPRI